MTTDDPDATERFTGMDPEPSATGPTPADARKLEPEPWVAGVWAEGDGSELELTEPALPISDPARVRARLRQIDDCVRAVAMREKISMEAAYGWAADLLDHGRRALYEDAHLTIPAPRSRRWGSRGLAVLVSLVLLAGLGSSVFWMVVWLLK